MSSYPTALRQESLASPIENEVAAPHFSAERTDLQLVESVLKGDELAFEEIFHRHKRMVAAIGRRHFAKAEEIEEIIQISFAKAFRQMASFRGGHEGSLSGWLAKIAANACFDVLRTQRRRAEKLSCELNDGEAQLLLDLSGPNSSVAEKRLADSDLAHKLLTHLSASDRSLLEMLYVHEFSVAEIADLQGCSAASVKVRAWRARGQLRKVLRRLL